MEKDVELRVGVYATVKAKIETANTPIPLRNREWHFHSHEKTTEFYVSPTGRLKVHETYLSSLSVAENLANAVREKIKMRYGETAEIYVKTEETWQRVAGERRKKQHTEIALKTIEKMKA